MLETQTGDLHVQDFEQLLSFQIGSGFKGEAMAFYPLQIAGLVLGFLGAVGTLATTLLPQWRVSAFIGSNIIVFERLWEGPCLVLV